MKRTHFLIIILGLIAFTSSCSKHETEISDALAGSWKWVSTVGGIGGFNDTPANTGNNIDLYLSDNGNYAYLTNGVVTSQGTYTLSIRDNKKFIDFSGPNMNMFEAFISSIQNNILTIAEDHPDGFTYTYVRN